MTTYTHQTLPRVRTCEVCCVRMTTDPKSPVCAHCLADIVHQVCNETPQAPRPPAKRGLLRAAWDRLWIFWRSCVERDCTGGDNPCP